MYELPDGARLSRRRLVGLAAASVATVLVGACDADRLLEEKTMRPGRSGQASRSPRAEGRIEARPSAPSEAGASGLQPLGTGASRDGLLYVPRDYRVDQPAPLAVMLHGAGGDAHGGLAPFLDLADQAGLILVAPQSRRQTWDVLTGGYGPDIAFIDDA